MATSAISVPENRKPEAMTDYRRYTQQEREQHEPQACPSCGHRVRQGWVDATVRSDPTPMSVLGRWECETPGCQYGPPVAPSA